MPDNQGENLLYKASHILVWAAFAAIAISRISFGCPAIDKFAWPEATRESRPWTYWWWMGSAIEKEEIKKHLEIYHKVGIGGVHIIPIYGAKGYEERYIRYLTPEWMEMLRFTVAEAARLDMGVDMTLGTGWPFGGEWVRAEDAAVMALSETYSLSGGERFDRKIRSSNEKDAKDALLKALMAFSETGDTLDLSSKVDSEGNLDWVTPPGNWKIYALFQGRTDQQVKRAAPGGEGNVIDYFSRTSLDNYLARFDRALADFPSEFMVRSFYHDSYEVYQADWTDNLFEEFSSRRGYDLRRFLPALLGADTDRVTVQRVRCDYRETIADLLLENFTLPWVNWCRARGALTRNEAHGSPGNLLDLYAAADIPETETFGPGLFQIPGLRLEQNLPQRFGRSDPLVYKFASSAANVKGRPLVSSETCTWLGEHFQVALSQVKPEIDRLFTSGINHIFYHGMTYSPARSPWPGWLFYASTDFDPTITIWNDLPELNAYVSRCQSFLQSGLPDNDVLLYFPIYDLWQKEISLGEFEDENRNLLHYFGVHNSESWLSTAQKSFGGVARYLRAKGYSFDYVSDRQLNDIAASREGIRAGKINYRLLLVPECNYVLPETMEKFVRLAENGATVIFLGKVPADVPGLGDLTARHAGLEKLLKLIKPVPVNSPHIRQAVIGKGKFMIGNSLSALLVKVGVHREPLADHGIEFIRRAGDGGKIYFLVNPGPDILNTWVSLGTKAKSAVIFDPLTAGYGLASLKEAQEGKTQVYLQLEPGESLLLRTFFSSLTGDQKWYYVVPDGNPVRLAGPWEITFTAGGPSIPRSFKTDRLVSWTEAGGEEAKIFAGTARYKIYFEMPKIKTRDWLLELGRVCESARIWINGQYLGTVWSHPYRVKIGGTLKEGENTLEIEVTNLSANRIAEQDRRGVPWRLFHDINFVNIKYEQFDASGWPPMPSGLLGPVQIIPLKLFP